MAAAAAAGFGMSAHAAPPPASAFGRVPAVVDAAISPGGQRVAILGGTSEQRVISIATIDQPGLPLLQLGELEATDLKWAGDDYVIATVAYWQKVDAKRAYRMERHIAVTPDGKAASRFLDTRTTEGYLVGGQPILGVAASGSQARVLLVDLSENAGSSGTADTRMKRKNMDSVALAIWSVDPATGAGKLVERGDSQTDTWAVDLSGEPRVRLEIDEINHRFSVFGKPKGKSQWSLVFAGGSFDSRRLYYGYSEPDDAIYLAQDGKLVKKRMADGAIEPVSDGGPSLALVFDEHRNTAVGVTSGAERPAYQWLDPEIAAAHGVLARAFKAQNVDLMGWSKDRTRLIARVSGPSSPPVWYLYDRPRKEVSPLAEEYPELKGAAMGTTRFFTYKAADGLEIPAYVTLPPGAAQGARLPLVVLPHGGPRSRDAYDFDFIAQFLATRGYAVLQPQFRGSWGFGDDFERAGRGEWGGKMQTDLLDGVAALAAAGDIDPKRVCIAGASFGGYAALAGAALHPDKYRCAASIAGIGDLAQLIAEDARLYGRESAGMDELREEVGLAAKDKVAAMSPARHAEAVTAPVLLIHGDRDTVVQISQSQRMADVLKAAGKPYEFIVLEGENHYLTKSANRTRMLEALEAFLAKNLPAS
ncbi:S9 family peptidase [Phenylobacterium sp.]|uniref:alpha/beta hydrolase family protein n=1 Tax=Phenylobacterium sp. TaxID=1871053 RepID=UPI0025FD793E|nr:S9 family peptidase [Phenylobacterium sp.]MBX3486057.1 S9 family peptidase [Phenylobacterium sp.]